MRPNDVWRWLVVALLAGLAPADALARLQDPTSASERTYIAPDASFSVPVPEGWTAEEGDGVVVLTGPDGRLRASIVAVETPDPDAAVAAAMAIAEPDYRLPSSPDRQEPPGPPGVDRLVVVTYDGGLSGREIVQAVARVVGERTYVAVYRGPVQQAIARRSQLSIIDSGLLIADVEQLDLSGERPAAFDERLQGELGAYVEGLLTDYGIPGASIVVVQGGEVAYAGGFGVTEVGGAPVDADTRMMIGSATKSMTTMMAATRVDAGEVTWDTPVVEILPYFRVAESELSRAITLRNLFCACSGVPRRDLEFLFNANDLTPEALIRSLATFEFATGVGEAFQYSNQMAAAGGYAAGVAGSGGADLAAAYEEAMDERVFDPIGMGRTTLDVAAVEAEGNYATPHGQTLQVGYEPITLEDEATLGVVAPAGAVWSTADDLGRYLITELGAGVAPDGTRVVSEENLAETWEPQVQIDARSSYGLGWVVGEERGLAKISHDGNTLGFTSQLEFLPDADIGFGLIANAQAANGFAVAVEQRLYELLYGREQTYDELVQYELGVAQAAAVSGVDLPAGSAAAFVGTYRNDALGDVSVALDDAGVPVLDAGEFSTRIRQTWSTNGVVLTWDPPFAGGELSLEGTSLVLTLGAERYVFVRLDDEGTPVASPVASPRAAGGAAGAGGPGIGQT